MTKKTIGLFGGSFDPPHDGHVALVQAGLDAGLDKIYVIPALPVHRELSGLASARMRFDWLVDMFADDPEVQVVDWEISRNRLTPAIETLRHFSRMFPHTIPWLMLGADAWGGLPSWRAYPEHRALCNVAVFARRATGSETGFETVCGLDGWKQLDLKQADLKQADLKQADLKQADLKQTELGGEMDCRDAGHWAYIQAELPDISATELRNDARRGKVLTGKVPEIVRRNIEQVYGNSMERT